VYVFTAAKNSSWKFGELDFLGVVPTIFGIGALDFVAQRHNLGLNFGRHNVRFSLTDLPF